MDYTKEQKKAIAKLLLDILSIDENIDSREVGFLDKILDMLTLSPQEHFEITHINTLRCLSIIKSMTIEQKSDFAVMMRDMIVADNHIDPKEAEAFYEICEYIDIKGVGLSI